MTRRRLVAARTGQPKQRPGGYIPVGALVGRPGVPSRICQNPGPGPRAGECGGSMQQREGKRPSRVWIASLQSSYHLIHSLARPPPCAAAPCSPSTVCSYDMVCK